MTTDRRQDREPAYAIRRQQMATRDMRFLSCD
jgi:hypothetical protein